MISFGMYVYTPHSLKTTAKVRLGTGTMIWVLANTVISGNWQSILRIDAHNEDLGLVVYIYQKDIISKSPSFDY